MTNQSIRLALLVLAGGGALGAQEFDRRVYPDSQPFPHYAWVIDTASLEGGPVKVLRRPGKRPQDVILVARAATPEDLLTATQALDLLRARDGDKVGKAVDTTPRGRLNRDSPTTARRILAMEMYLGALRESSLQYTEDFGEVRLMALKLDPPGHLKARGAPKGKP